MALVAGVVLATVGCSTQDPVGIRVTLEESGSGTVAVSALTLPEIAVIEARDSAGIAWQEAARLTLTSGTFANLDDVRIGDVVVDAATFSPGAGTLRIRFPRGDAASWFRMLHVGAVKRAPLRKTLSNAVSEIDLHENITISVRVPGARVAAGLVSPVPRISVSAKNDLATMVAPLDVLEEDAPALVLVVNWERTSPGLGG